MDKATYVAGTKRLKLFRLDNGYDFVSRKDVPVVDGNDAPDAVVVLARNPEGKLLVIFEERPVIGGHLWDLPAGMLEPGENPVDAAKREVHEETGLELYNADLWKYNPFVSPGMVDESTAIVTGYVRGDITDKNLVGDENIKAFLLDADDMARLGFQYPNTRMTTRLAFALL
jgi:ADP-ribose pyrophosphatase